MSWIKTVRKALVRGINERLSISRAPSSEVGRRGTEQSQQRAIYERLTPSYDLYSTIQEIRRMDVEDGVVKQMHSRTAKGLTKGGLILKNPSKNKAIESAWQSFVARCELNNRLKLISDARGLVVEGSLPLQWVLDKQGKHVVRCVRLPTETIRPIVGIDGQFEDLRKAYAQYSFQDGKDIAHFAAWQLYVTRLDPDNFDDMNALGRPLLDATRKRWRQLMMTLDDSVKRRHLRSGNRTVHVLEGADDKELDKYKKRVESEENDISSNYYMNKKGAVSGLEGDANLDQIADIALLMDVFFAGTGIPKSLLGLNLSELSRDILMDLKAEFYDELDILQDSLAMSYQHGFHLDLLINGINPEAHKFEIKYGERLTETLNQRTDRALKLAALGASRHTSLETAGLNPAEEEELLKDEHDNLNTYPEDIDLPGVPNEVESAVNKRSQQITVTPGNASKAESATDIKNP